MNEQFKKLALKAGCRSRKFTTGVGMYQGVDNDLQKFAELIVRECGVALNPPVQNRNVISREQAYNLIKKHFGVEE